LIAGGVSLKMRERSGLDLPEERRPDFPYSVQYFNKRYGPRGWSNASTLNIAIGQGENAQTVVNMARFYTALATDGAAGRPSIAAGKPRRDQLFRLTPEQLQGLHSALAGVVSVGGTAAGSRIEGLMLAGKTGTAQAGSKGDHAWFVGYAPADKPSIVVAVMLEFGGHGSRAAHIASAIMGHYLKSTPAAAVQTDG
jgi:penicillin-binding protein 2